MSELVQKFMTLFDGRRDCYAVGKPHRIPEKAAQGKLEYILVKAPLTESDFKDHLRGKKRLGVYPLVDGWVQWFAIDFDAPAGSATGFQGAWAEAVKQAERLESEGLIVYLERSRSGEGVHLWGFFEEPVEASLVLQGIRPLVLEADSYDRMYPVQAETTSKRPYGNLIALPFHGGSLREGNSVFLDRVTQEVIPPKQFLESVQYNLPVVLRGLASKSKPVRVESTFDEQSFDPSFAGRPKVPLRGFLKMVSAYGNTFMRHAVEDAPSLTQTEWWVALGQASCFRHGRDAAHLLSQLDPARYNAQETDELYDRVSQQPPHGCGYIHEHFPQYACPQCDLTAPYWVAKRSILKLVGDTSAGLERPDWRAALGRVRKRYEGSSLPGVTWGVAGLDAYTRLRRGELVVIGARPSIGKTALMVDAMVSLAERGIPVMVFSSETGEVSLMDRILARLSGVDSLLLRGEGHRSLFGDELAAVERGAEKLEGLPLYINYTATRADQILDLIEDVVLTNRIPLGQHYVVFQDYIQFGTPGEGASDEYGKVSKLAAEFKFIAKILGCTFVTFSQLKRDKEGDEDPDLGSFKNTGRIEEGADVALVLTGKRQQGVHVPRTLLGLKQREGVAGWAIPLLLNQTTCQFGVPQVEQEQAPGPLFESDELLLKGL